MIGPKKLTIFHVPLSSCLSLHQWFINEHWKLIVQWVIVVKMQIVCWCFGIQARVLEGDRISNVAGDLATVTSTKQMYGGDIAAAVRIIKTIATRMNDQVNFNDV